LTQTTVDKLRVDTSGSGIVDCDVHPMLPKGKPLMEYIPPTWRQRLGDFDMGYVKLDGPRYRKPHSTNRIDATPPDGGPPGSDPHYMITDLIEPKNVMYAVLLPYQAGGLSSWVHADEAAVWAETFNRYFADHWLFDPRFRLVNVVSPLDPQLAVKEIERFADIPGVVGIRLPLLQILLGNRYWYPIYEAASHHELPILLHGQGASFQGAPTVSGGLPSTFAEKYAMLASAGLASNNLASLIFEGVFDRFPKLKVVFVEMGWTWVGPAMWKMDRSWRSFRAQVPWLTRPPTEYVLDHVRFTTQPMDDPQPREYLRIAAEMMHAERTLLLSTDYPHWDGDDPKLAFSVFPDELKRRIFRENALETFGQRLPAPEAVS
jgi:uncharacterized protein